MSKLCSVIVVMFFYTYSSSRDYLISEPPVVCIDWALGGFMLNVTACCERLTLPQNHIQNEQGD